jgi:cell division protein FtsX
MKAVWKATWILHCARRQVSTHRPIAFAATAAFCLLTLVLGGAVLGKRTAGRWGELVGQNIHVIVYLADDVDRDRARGLAEILRRVPSVAQVTEVESAQAFARLTSAVSALGVGAPNLDGLEPAYFPRSLEVKLAPAADLSERANDLAKRLRGVPGVSQVDAMTDGLARLSVWVGLGRKLGLCVFLASAVLTLGALTAVFLRSRGVARRRAAVLVQLGETTSAIRLPSSLWMAAAALAGGGVGALSLDLAWRPLIHRLEMSLGMFAASPLPRLGRAEIAVGLGLAVFVGLAMGFFATPLPQIDDET